MTDSRQQFEAWAATAAPEMYLQYLPRVECYSNSGAEAAWRASRVGATEKLTDALAGMLVMAWHESEMTPEEFEKDPDVTKARAALNLYTGNAT